MCGDYGNILNILVVKWWLDDIRCKYRTPSCWILMGIVVMRCLVFSTEHPLGAQHESPPKVLRLLLISWNPFLGKQWERYPVPLDLRNSNWFWKKQQKCDYWSELPPTSTRLSPETQVFLLKKYYQQGTFGGSVQLSARSSIDLQGSGLKQVTFWAPILRLAKKTLMHQTKHDH